MDVMDWLSLGMAAIAGSAGAGLMYGAIKHTQVTLRRDLDDERQARKELKSEVMQAFDRGLARLESKQNRINDRIDRLINGHQNGH